MNTMMLWVLGAPTIHMNLIEELLRKCGQNVTFATKDRLRFRNTTAVCYDGSVYQADSIKLPSADLQALNFVECQASGEYPNMSSYACHHDRLTSAEYTHPPQEMLAKSSIGQVLIWLSKIAGDSGERPPFDWPQLDAPYLENGQENHERSGLIGTALSGGELLCRGRWLRIPDELRFAAAMSYNAFAAHRGEYPGVEPEKLQAWYLDARTKHLSCRRVEMMEQIDRVGRLLQRYIHGGNVVALAAPDKPVIKGAAALQSDDPIVMVGPDLPELEAPAAEARQSIWYEILQGRRKWEVLRARPHTVSCWMNLHSRQGIKVYGTPARGVAYFLNER
jgi:hypothetical protein